jgi:hypothetical protein
MFLVCYCTAIFCARPAGWYPETEFVNLIKNLGIDSLPGGPERQPYLTYRPARLYRLAESIPGLLKSLQIRA